MEKLPKYTYANDGIDYALAKGFVPSCPERHLGTGRSGAESANWQDPGSVFRK